MGLEQSHVRAPLVRTINSSKFWRWIPSRNVVNPEALVSSVMPGQPDGYAHRWGGSGIIYFETKCVTLQKPTSFDMTQWERQHNWWERNCQDFGHVPYWIVCGWYPESVESTSDFEWPSWRWFAVTPEMWLYVQARLPEGQVSLPLNPLTAKKSHMPTDITAETEWAEFALYYQSGKFIIPEIHPLHQQLDLSL